MFLEKKGEEFHRTILHPPLHASFHPSLQLAFPPSSVSLSPIPFSSVVCVSGFSFFFMQTRFFNLTGARTTKISSTSYLSMTREEVQATVLGKRADWHSLSPIPMPGLSSCEWRRECLP